MRSWIQLLSIFLLLATVVSSKRQQARQTSDEDEVEEQTKAKDTRPRYQPPHLTKKQFEEVFPDEKPEPLGEAELKWMNTRHKYLIKKAVDNGANEWERLQKIAELFYEQHQSRRRQSQAALEKYCTDNLRRLIGDVNVDRLMYLYMESATPEHMQSAFASMVSRIRDEEMTNQAEQYGVFCKKILRIVSLEPAALMDWLSDEQRAQLQLLIIDKQVSDDQIYERVYEFYNETTDKEEAQETIFSACRRFIADLFGDDIVEEIEDLKDQSSHAQIMAFKLHQHIKEIENAKEAESERVYGKSVWLCERIYVGYNGYCECGGRADICDDTQACMDCRGNTEGAMCQRCKAGYEWALLGDRCVEACVCNGHSTTCDDYGMCQNCTANTIGKHCDQCEEGFIGNAKGGTEDDCKECTCRLDQQCVLAADGSIECVTPLEAIFEADYSNDTDIMEALARFDEKKADVGSESGSEVTSEVGKTVDDLVDSVVKASEGDEAKENENLNVVEAGKVPDQKSADSVTVEGDEEKENVANPGNESEQNPEDTINDEEGIEKRASQLEHDQAPKRQASFVIRARVQERTRRHSGEQ